MPYFVYKITAGPTPLLKDLTLLQRFAGFKEARDYARSAREGLGDAGGAIIKVMFADTELHAEEQLLEKRDAPVLREWEK